ncbi:MAG: class I SAM-dependent methyltransferase [Flavobacteriales bacterium]|nr:class I SAM-dependent methyltransferase [Flavobacteriales bacterium]
MDGLALTILVPMLQEHGVLDAFESKEPHDLDALAASLGANPGYLNVLCRLCASQGWLIRETDGDAVCYRRSSKEGWKTWRQGVVFARKGQEWLRAAEGMWNRPEAPWTSSEEASMEAFIEVLQSLGDSPWRAHLEGALAAPWFVALGTLHGTDPLADWASVSVALSRLHPSRGKAALRALNALDFMGTEKGGFFLARSAAYGVTTSYIRTFLWADELTFGDGGRLWRIAPGEAEIHVDRTLNVWGSGGAHGAYFLHLDEVVRTVFDAPLEDQPVGLCDMGCGNGALLLHLEEFIRSETLRGQHLDSHPLVLVGADFNQAALDATATHFRSEGVDGHFLWGDIGDPDRLDRDLQGRHGIALGELLNVRSFLDHNRVFNRPEGHRDAQVLTTGAFAFRGERLRARDVEQSLKEHFLKWRPHVEKHGLLVIELHTMSPEDAAERHGRMPATAYDATHGFSDQYIVEVPVYDAMAAEAGLHKVDAVSRTFPRQLPATVSLRYFLGG